MHGWLHLCSFSLSLVCLARTRFLQGMVWHSLK